MIFNTPEYYLLLLVSAGGFRWLKGTARQWLLVLVGAAFFVWFSADIVGWTAAWLCLLLLLWESVCGRWCRLNSRWCVFCVIQAAAVLLVFKYWNFATATLLPESLATTAHWSGAFLPLGISFFTFEFIHYAIDRWKGKAERGTTAEYLSFILFFPTMVAGPIKRFQDWQETLRAPSDKTTSDWLHGITRILAGLVKKLAVADVLSSFTGHLNTHDVAIAQRWALPLWILAYGIKIYADFSSYSDIAIGSARLFGLRVKENFDWPYLQQNIADFWTHWHISLYRWLVDYVFIPMGGSRVRLPIVCRNILLTMLISGLWHGASMNFVVWGLYHGLLLVTHRLWRAWHPMDKNPAAWKRVSSTLLTFVSVNIGWVFFAMDLPTALLWMSRVFLLTP